jgi:hypothetical protein
MKTPTYTVNAAVEILHRNPRLILKALRHVPPDEVQGKRKLWKMKTIEDAIDRLPSTIEAKAAAHRNSGFYHEQRYEKDDWDDISNIVDMWRDDRFEQAQEEFDEEFEAVAKLPLAARRAKAKSLGPKLQSKHELFTALGREIGTDWEHTGWRADAILDLERRRIKAACQWTKTEFSKNFVTTTWWKENLPPDSDDLMRRGGD